MPGLRDRQNRQTPIRDQIRNSNKFLFNRSRINSSEKNASAILYVYIRLDVGGRRHCSFRLVTRDRMESFRPPNFVSKNSLTHWPWRRPIATVERSQLFSGVCQHGGNENNPINNRTKLAIIQSK